MKEVGSTVKTDAQVSFHLISWKDNTDHCYSSYLADASVGIAVSTPGTARVHELAAREGTLPLQLRHIAWQR